MPLVVLCREMKWTWQEALDQPQWLIASLLGYMQAEADYYKKKSKK